MGKYLYDFKTEKAESTLRCKYVDKHDKNKNAFSFDSRWFDIILS